MALTIYNQGYGRVLQALNKRHNPRHPHEKKGMKHFANMHKRGDLKIHSSYPASVYSGYKKIMEVFKTGKYPIESKKEKPKPKYSTGKGKIHKPQAGGSVASAWPHR